MKPVLLMMLFAFSSNRRVFYINLKDVKSGSDFISQLFEKSGILGTVASTKSSLGESPDAAEPVVQDAQAEPQAEQQPKTLTDKPAEQVDESKPDKAKQEEQQTPERAPSNKNDASAEQSKQISDQEAQAKDKQKAKDKEEAEIKKEEKQAKDEQKAKDKEEQKVKD
ncbi:hypothetical protein HK407_08g13250 [Ordospora pajunii]|uniref:uncharacterized protein n=1 Tax=Ordospora pajunii TaxID=3039483 RepID=UPI002952640A|nr:uncharacterized protein HK407_08g13250 [Ordospora pajunii]KAH9411051.1 hypothetical protein HK407_08g13250 [Ordospora pajunii]